MEPSWDSDSDEFIGQHHTQGCALEVLDADSQLNDERRIRKICGLAKCSFKGFLDADGITHHTDEFTCYKADHGLRDDNQSDEDYIEY